MEKQTTKTAACPDASLLLLPEDSLIEILVRLPIKSMLRFKSVCKSWGALIQSPFFIHVHTTFNSSSSKLGGTFILHVLPFTDDGYGFRCTDDSWYKFIGDGCDWHWDNTNCVRYWVSDDHDWLWDETNGRWYWVGDDQEELFKADDDQLLIKLDNLALPSCYKSTYRNRIKGSCNGLICLYDFELRVVSLCNPATRQFRTLPKPITILKGVNDSSILLFGFDIKTKDYKVLMITYLKPGSYYSCRVQVYSLSTDSWRLLEGINSLPGPPTSEGLYLNGSCFFLAIGYYPGSRTYSMLFINSFDFTKEIFTTTTQLPDHHHRQHLFLYCLGGEKMTLFTTLRKTSSGYLFEDKNEDDDPYGYDDCDIWVLNEQEGCCGGVNQESWTKLHSFQIKNTRCVKPKGISNNGKFVILETIGSSYAKSIQLYNLVTKETKVDFLRCTVGVEVSTADVYKPSLVSIIGGNGNGAAAGLGDRI